ncbi:MAG: hypothetical protein R3C54_05090 [Parvularculaceae bacterium]
MKTTRKRIVEITGTTIVWKATFMNRRISFCRQDLSPASSPRRSSSPKAQPP